MSRLHVALYSGGIFEGDAISNSLLLKLRTAERLQSQGWDLAVTAFCQGSSVRDPNIRGVRNLAALLAEPAFRAADLHIFEFGIFYELFDVFPYIPQDKVRAVVYHNVTPRELVEAGPSRVGVERAERQKHNLLWADLVICVSDTNRRDLAELGIPSDRMTTLPLPPGVARPSSARSDRPVSRPVELLFVGRPVRAKGVIDLLEAARILRTRTSVEFRVRIVGRLDFADTEVVDAIRAANADPQLADVVQERWNVAHDQMPLLYEQADALVMPSYHEGYCVPVVEAFASQCHVISYDNSNLPAVGGGLSELVPTGDVNALAEALRRFVVDLSEARRSGHPLTVHTSDGPQAEADWRERAACVALRLRPDYEARFGHLLLEAMRLIRSPFASDKLGVAG